MEVSCASCQAYRAVKGVLGAKRKGEDLFKAGEVLAPVLAALGARITSKHNPCAVGQMGHKLGRSEPQPSQGGSSRSWCREQNWECLLTPGPNPALPSICHPSYPVLASSLCSRPAPQGSACKGLRALARWVSASPRTQGPCKAAPDRAPGEARSDAI